MLKLQSVTFGDLAVNKQNCICLVEEHCSWRYFSLFMAMTSHPDTGLFRSGTAHTNIKLSEYKQLL